MDKVKSWVAEKTDIINIDDRPVLVKSLPADLRFEIETYDLFKQEYLKVIFEYEKMRHALNSKLNEIMKKATLHITSAKPDIQKSTGETNDN